MKNAVLALIIGLLFSVLNPVEAQMSNREIRKTLKMRPPKEVRKQAKSSLHKRANCYTIHMS